MSLRSRLALLVGLAVAASMIAATVAAGAATRHELRQEVDHFLQQRVREINAGGFGGTPFTDRDDPRRRGPAAFPVRLDSVTQIIGPNGAVYNPFGEVVLSVSEADLAVAAGDRGAVIHDADGLDGVHYRVITAPIDRGGAVQVARDLTEIDDSVRDVRRLLVFFGLIGTALAALIAWLIADRTTAPVRRLTAAAEHVAATEELDPDIEVEGTDEVGRLASAFRKMLQSLAISKAQQQRLVMDASHELRTPLTSLRTNLEVLHRTPEMAHEDRQELMADLDFEVQELSGLVGELVDLATDADAATGASESFDLAELCRELAERSRRRTGRTISVDGPDCAPVTASRGGAERSILNLLDNAAKFSPPESPLEIRIGSNSVEVRDHGPGVADEDKGRIFDRFYRSVAARSRPGSGLGLSIVATVADRHGGSTWVDDADGGGAVIGFSLGPVTEPTPATHRPDPSGSPID